MAKSGSSRLRPLMFWFTPITRSPAQGPACKDLGRNGQKPAITPKAAYTPVPKRAGSRSRSKTRSQSQKSTCKDSAKWPKTSHLAWRPLTLRFLSAPVHALHL
ncbi:hypothetical protein CUC11_06440 [Lacticaseibacillus rhamnosus]|nr:hypothetical protein CUC11_06440 [Lacticaseibacillus rhamnosus]